MNFQNRLNTTCYLKRFATCSQTSVETSLSDVTINKYIFTTLFRHRFLQYAKYRDIGYTTRYGCFEAPSRFLSLTLCSA